MNAHATIDPVDAKRALIIAALPEGKTLAEAIRIAGIHRDRLWSQPDWMSLPEEKRSAELERICTKMLGGNEDAGKALAIEGCWS